MEKGKPSIYDIDNTKPKNENPFKANNQPGKKRGGNKNLEKISRY